MPDKTRQRALEDFEDAIKQLFTDLDIIEDGELVLGWVLSASTLTECECGAGDDSGHVSSPIICITRRGQAPVLSRGILADAMDMHQR